MLLKANQRVVCEREKLTNKSMEKERTGNAMKAINLEYAERKS